METKRYNCDLSSGLKTIDVQMKPFGRYSLQVVWEDIAGGTDGTVKLKQSIDGVNYDQIKTLNASSEEVDFGVDISTEAGSSTLEDKDGFTGSNLRITIDPGQITDGNVYLFLNLE